MPRRPAFRAGTASIIGLPNAGKSTLLNALVGEKLAIVSSKPQTTRTALDGVLTTPAAQIVFVDTPGIHKSDTPYNQKMMRSVRASLDAIDVLVFVHDAQRVISTEVEGALDLVKKAGVPAILVLNKIDLVEDRQKVLGLLAQFPKYHEFAAYVPVSAQTGEGVETVRDEIIKLLPRVPKIYPEDHITQMPSRFLAAEIIREKILAATHQEVPHAVAVLVETWEETPKLTRISATIYVERQGQKTIVIGQKGAGLKAIGTAARLEMEEFFGTKIFLELFVKVRPDWRNQPEFLNELDWRRMTGERDE
ncbi:MAG: GTPase Era [Acidobacteriaceae bacterium]|nr:GTPase Era [Acidobacteriaceae bacterium]